MMAEAGRFQSRPANLQPWTIRLAGYALPAILVLFIVVFSFLKPDTFPTILTLNTLLRTNQFRRFSLLPSSFLLSSGSLIFRSAPI